MVRAKVEPHLLNRKRPIQVVKLSYESMLISDASAVACSEKLLFSSLKYSAQWAMASRLDQSDDVAFLLLFSAGEYPLVACQALTWHLVDSVGLPGYPDVFGGGAESPSRYFPVTRMQLLAELMGRMPIAPTNFPHTYAWIRLRETGISTSTAESRSLSPESICVSGQAPVTFDGRLTRLSAT